MNVDEIRTNQSLRVDINVVRPTANSQELANDRNVTVALSSNAINIPSTNIPSTNLCEKNVVIADEAHVRTINDGPVTKNVQQTIDELLNTHKSLVRFGDGEYLIMLNKGNPAFQNKNNLLMQRLREIIKSNNENILVGIVSMWGPYKCDEFCKSKRYWENLFSKIKTEVSKYIDFNKTYYSADITRVTSFNPRLSADRKADIQNNHFNKIKKIWENKDITVIEGCQTRMGVGNDLFSNCRSIQRILCPATNAFNKYDEIFNFCKTQDKNRLYILALGPTAKVLAYDMANLGFRVLDLGHLDICYEWFLRRAGGKCRVPCKYVNEVPGGGKVADCIDPKYLQEIIAKF